MDYELDLTKKKVNLRVGEKSNIFIFSISQLVKKI